MLKSGAEPQGTNLSAPGRSVMLADGSLPGILHSYAVQEPLGTGGHFPVVRPGEEVNRPPVGGQTAAQNFRDQHIKVQHALSEGSVGAGLIVVKRTVGIHEVGMADSAAQAGEQFQCAARQRLLPDGLPPSHRRYDVGVASVLENPEIRMGAMVHPPQHFRRLIESKARLKLPQDTNATRRGPAGTFLKGFDHPLPGK